MDNDKLNDVANMLGDAVDKLHALIDHVSEPVSEHEAGEKFNNEWEYVGDKRIPHKGECFRSGMNNNAFFIATDMNKPRHILQRIGTHAKSQIKTTVTVWGKHSAFGATIPFNTTTYTFTGTPDVDRVKRETLDKGALAIKIESSVDFKYGCFNTPSLIIWNTCIKGCAPSMGVGKYRGCYDGGDERDRSADIEQAITEYLADDKIDVADLDKSMYDIIRETVRDEFAKMFDQHCPKAGK